MNHGLSIRRGLLLAFIAFVGLTAVALIAFWPFVFGKLSHAEQFYGATSAAASSLALVGVAISLLHQARAGHTAREQAIRSLQQQLIRMEMDDPSLMTAIGAPWGLPIPAESARIRDYLYVHMWATSWAGYYVLGEMNTAEVRGVARLELFGSEAGRAYWAAVRERALTTNEGKYLRFVRIVDEEYHKVLASNARVADPVRITDTVGQSNSCRKSGLRRSVLASVVLITGSLAGWKLSQRPRKRS